MRLDHLLSKENLEKDILYWIYCLFFNVLLLVHCLIYGAVAQLARAPALQAGGQEFDSPHLHQYIEKYIDKEEKKVN